MSPATSGPGAPAEAGLAPPPVGVSPSPEPTAGGAAQLSLPPPAIREHAGPAGFNHRLESLRGVAAMMVAVGHGFLVLDAPAWPGVLRLCNGHAAVRLFFVLSGYVLGLALSRMHEPPARGLLIYAMRRLLRIYPAFLGATLLVAGAALSLPLGQASPVASRWFHQFYQDPLTAAVWWDNLLFRSASLNCVTWTLWVELLGSWFLGAVHFLTRGWGWRGRLAILGVLMMAAWCWPSGALIPYLFMFWLGYLLPALSPTLTQSGAGRRWVGPALLLAAAVVFLRSTQTRFQLWGEPLGATMILACLVHGRPLACYRLLDRAVVRFYGRISYSFYLLHFPALYLISLLCLRWVPGETLLRWPNLWAVGLGAGSVIAVTPLAWLLYLGAERPGIALSKHLAGRMTKILGPPGAARLTRRQALDEPTTATPSAPQVMGK